MGRCAYDRIQGLAVVFSSIKEWPDIRESKPGIYYLKSQGFLHFHDNKEGKIWADVNDGSGWKSLDVPNRLTKGFIKGFLQELRRSYVKAGGR